MLDYVVELLTVNIIKHGFTTTADNVCTATYFIPSKDDDNTTSVTVTPNNSNTVNVFSEDDPLEEQVCNRYANGTLTSCLATGGYTLDDLCSDEIMKQMWNEFERTDFILSFGIIKLIGVIIFTLIDICKFCKCWYCDQAATLRYGCVLYLFIIKCIFWFFALVFAVETAQSTQLTNWIGPDDDYPAYVGSLTSSFGLTMRDYPAAFHVYTTCADRHPVIYYDISDVNGLGPFADLILTILIWIMFFIRVLMLICCGTGSVVELGEDGYELVHQCQCQ